MRLEKRRGDPKAPVAVAKASASTSSTLAKASWRHGGHRGERIGEARHPGPCSSFSKFCLLTLNVGGPAGAWQALEHFASWKEPLVMALQETKFLKRSGRFLNRRTQRLGFYTVSADGARCSDRWGKTRARGGACLLVDKRLAFRPASKRVESDSQVVSAWVGERFVSCFYAPPVPDADAQAQAAQALQDISKIGSVWETQTKSLGILVFRLLLSATEELFLPNSPTRWEGNREVDWIATSQTDQVAQPRCLEPHFSDHKVVFSEVAMKVRGCMLGSFQQAASWPLPEGMSCSDWRNVLQDVWQELQAPFPSGLSCQEKWDEFMCQLDTLYRTATKRVLDLTSDPALKRKLVQQCNNFRQKGLASEWSQRPWVRQGPRTVSASSRATSQAGKAP